jgi:hypothetical protein
MRLLLLLPLLLLAACADAPADAPAPSAAGSTLDDTPGPTTDEEAAEAVLAAVTPADAFVGDWMCQEGDAPFGEISIGMLNDEGIYSTFIDSRPQGSGTWTLDGSTLTLTGTDGTFSFTDADVVEGILMLTDDAGTTFACNNLPVSP